jgi:imidazolonepropionase-like amidohydrolase
MKNIFDEQPSTRREFLGLTAAGASALLIAGANVPGLTGCFAPANWKPEFIKNLVLKNCRLFDGVTLKLHDGLTVLVSDGVIKDVVKQGSLGSLEGYRVADLRGMTLLPGFIDNHVHMTVPFMYDINLNAVRQMNAQLVKNFESCLMGGVTTVRDLGGFPGKIKKFSRMAELNEIPGPRVISSLSPIAAREREKLGAPEKAPYFTNPVIKWLLGGNYAERPQSEEEVKAACEDMILKGARWLKTLHQEHSYSYNSRKLPNHSDEAYRAILEIGTRHGIKCALHEPLLSGFIKGVDLGFHTLEHMPMDGGIPDRYIEMFINRNMSIHATLMAYGDVFKEEELLGLVEKRGKDFLVPEAVKQIKLQLKKSISQGEKKLTMVERKKLMFDRQYLMDMHKNQVANLKKLYRVGANLGIGTDLGGYYSGFFGRYGDELIRFVDAGIPAADTLKMATSVNAKILGMDESIGSVARGKKADLIVLDGDPLKNIQTVRNIRLVMKEGVVALNDGIVV